MSVFKLPLRKSTHPGNAFWIDDADGEPVMTVQSPREPSIYDDVEAWIAALDARKQEVIRAINCHDELVAALETCLTAAGFRYERMIQCVFCGEGASWETDIRHINHDDCPVPDVASVLARAKGERDD